MRFRNNNAIDKLSSKNQEIKITHVNLAERSNYVVVHYCETNVSWPQIYTSKFLYLFLPNILWILIYLQFSRLLSLSAKHLSETQPHTHAYIPSAYLLRQLSSWWIMITHIHTYLLKWIQIFDLLSLSFFLLSNVRFWHLKVLKKYLL